MFVKDVELPEHLPAFPVLAGYRRLKLEVSDGREDVQMRTGQPPIAEVLHQILPGEYPLPFGSLMFSSADVSQTNFLNCPSPELPH